MTYFPPPPPLISFPISISLPMSTTMEIIQTPPTNPPEDYHSNVDTSRPFSSVKEAVAIFGERFLTLEIYSPKPFSFPKQEKTDFSSSPSWKYISPSPSPPHIYNNNTLVDTLKKLKNELEETKEELQLLKERESENEVALASLNAELHKNMSKIAQAEATAAGKAAVEEEEGRRRDLIVRMESSPTLAQILSFSQEKEGDDFEGKKKERENVTGRKKKPIIPLVGDLFWRKKGSSTTLHNPLFSSSNVHWN